MGNSWAVQHFIKTIVEIMKIAKSVFILFVFFSIHDDLQRKKENNKFHQKFSFEKFHEKNTLISVKL